MVIRKIGAGSVASAAILGFAICLASPAAAQDAAEETPAPVTIEGSYKSDVAAIVDGGVETGARWLDNLNLTASLDLDQIAGWHGATVFVNVLNNFGGRPNDLAGSIQGINNIEVGNTRLKVYEAWIEQGFASDAASVRAGLYDLNSEFYQSDASGLLISPPFGIGSELSATGPNGPSIFPSTALAVRLAAKIGKGYAQVAVINAEAGTIGDEGGVAPFGREGVLLIGEAGVHANGKFAIGGWTYSKRQPTVSPPDLTQGPPPRQAWGAYFIAEQTLSGNADEGRSLQGFLRIGISDGKTTPFSSGWQAGILVNQPFKGRPASAFSLGVGSAGLSHNYRDAVPVGDPALRKAETIIEATYKDEILPGLSLQPDVQYVVHPSADPTIKNALVLGLRVQFDFKLR
jgi:porin